MISYVIDCRKGYCVHQGDHASCAEYIDTCATLWGHARSVYVIADGAKHRDRLLRGAKVQQ